MSEQSGYTWTQSNKDDLRKAVKNFNAKISRLEKKYANDPESLKALPKRTSQKDIRKLINNGHDLRRELNALRRFSDPGMDELVQVPITDYNLKITKWQKDDMRRRATRINQIRKKRLKDISNIEMKSRGESLGYTKGQIGMGKADEIALSPIKPFTPKMDRRNLNKKIDTLIKESNTTFWSDKEQFLRDNFIKGLEGNYKGLFPDDVEKIKEAVNKMTFKEFYKRFMENDEMEIVSPPTGGNAEDTLSVNIEALKSTWIPNYKKPKKKSKKKKG